jgi:hypothetical protein
MKPDSVARLTLLSAFLLLMAWAAPARAQESIAADDAAFAVLQQSLQPGDAVTITHLDGRRTKGKLIEVGSGLIRLRQNNEPRQVAAADIRKVQRTRMSLLLGIVIGAGAGAALGGTAYAQCDDCDSATSMVLLTAAVGAGVGCGIDALVNVPRTVYERKESRVSLGPTVTRGGGGVAVALRF